MKTCIEENDKELEALQQEMAMLNRELLNARVTGAKVATISPAPSGTVSPAPTVEISQRTASSPIPTPHPIHDETVGDDASTSNVIGATSIIAAAPSASTSAAGASDSTNATRDNISAHELQRALLVELAASVNSELTDAQALIASQQQELSQLEVMKERCEAQEILIAHFRQIVADLTGETKTQLEHANTVIEQQQQEMSRLQTLSNTFRHVFKELAGTVSEELTRANAVIPSQRLRIDDLESQISVLQLKLLGFQMDDQDHCEGLRYEEEVEGDDDNDDDEDEEEEEEESEGEEEETGGGDYFSNDDAMSGPSLPSSPLTVETSARSPPPAGLLGTPGQLDKNADQQPPLPAERSSPLSVEILDAAAQPKNITIIDLT